MYHHSYKNLSDPKKGAEHLSGFDSDTPIFEVGDYTEIDKKEFVVARVKKLPLSGHIMFMYELQEVAPIDTMVIIVERTIADLKKIIS